MDNFDYYKTKISQYKDKEIGLLVGSAQLIGPTEVLPGYVDIDVFTQSGDVHCLVKEDRADVFLRRYKVYDPKILRGILKLTKYNNPYLLIDGF